MKINKFNENDNTIINLSDLSNKNWDAERIVKNERGLKSYINSNGWIKKLPTQSNYTKIVYMTEEQADELNDLYAELKILEHKYNYTLSIFKDQ